MVIQWLPHDDSDVLHASFSNVAQCTSRDKLSSVCSIDATFSPLCVTILLLYSTEGRAGK